MSGSQRSKGGFSLLEVIVALAILAGAIATLGHVARLAIKNARTARDMTHAQLLCESKLAELTAGILPLEPVAGVGVDTLEDEVSTEWLYSVDVEQIDSHGLMAVRVSVYQDPSFGRNAAQFSLLRWIFDTSRAISDTGE